MFTEVIESLPRYRPQGNFAAWLFTIVRRRAANWYRRQRTWLPLEAAETRENAKTDPLQQAIQLEESGDPPTADPEAKRGRDRAAALAFFGAIDLRADRRDPGEIGERGGGAACIVCSAGSRQIGRPTMDNRQPSPAPEQPFTRYSPIPPRTRRIWLAWNSSSVPG